MKRFVGQKVTMNVNAKFKHDGEFVPEFGVVYTIREICDFGGGIVLRFKEINNKPGLYTHGGRQMTVECAFTASRFSPVVMKKTDISIFVKMLDTKQEISHLYSAS